MSAALLFSLVHLLYVLSGDESKIKRLEFKRHSAALCLEERWKTDRKKERKRSYRVCTFSPALYLWAMYTAESHDPKVHYMIWITMNFWLRWSICDCKHVCVCVCVFWRWAGLHVVQNSCGSWEQKNRMLNGDNDTLPT